MKSEIVYTLVDPGGNITALVRSDVLRHEYTTIAHRICEAHPQVEQVGFLSTATNADVRLEMAGGEFCGNALRAVGAVVSKEREKAKVSIVTDVCDDLFTVECTDITATVYVPRTLVSIDTDTVHLPGISHILRRDVDSPNPTTAQDFVPPVLRDRRAVGLMRYSDDVFHTTCVLTPTVWVRALGSVVAETACASGTIALAEYIYTHFGVAQITVRQPSLAVFIATVTGSHITLSGPVQINDTSMLV